MRKSLLKLTALTAVLSLSACSFLSPDNDSLGGVVLSTVSSTVGGKLKSDAPAKPDRAAATAAQRALTLIARTGRSGLVTTVPKLGRTTVMVEEARNGSYVTYRGTNNTSVTLRSGMIHATRGMGIDLMAQATSVPPSSLFKGGSFPKEYARAQRHLDGENHLLSADFLCVITRTGTETITILDKKHATTTFEETCKNDRRAFLNRYWVGTGSGTIWQSQQSISSLSGHIVSQYIAGK